MSEALDWSSIAASHRAFLSRELHTLTEHEPTPASLLDALQRCVDHLRDLEQDLKRAR